MKTRKFNLEDESFTRARLGKFWTPSGAVQCLKFFPARYHFNATRERQFQQIAKTDYNDNLRGRLNADA
jgi:hypothetical protein